jgi:sulfate adenylyltransferase subunit 2
MHTATNDDLMGLGASRVWDTEQAFRHLQAAGDAESKRTAERRLHDLGILPEAVDVDGVTDEHGRPCRRMVLAWDVERARARRMLVLFAQLRDLPGGQPCLHANDARGARYWIPLTEPVTPAGIERALRDLREHVGKDVALFPHGALVTHVRHLPALPGVWTSLLGYAPILEPRQATAATGAPLTPHLRRLEAESIHIFREAIAEAENPVLLYSAGKDSSVLLHLARKAFHPARPPLPLLHVDTTWKFQEMYLFRDWAAREAGMELLVHVNPEVIARNINPFDHGSALHTEIAKTEGLKQALDQHGFDVIIGGARRDEEKSRAKERIFSFRTAAHRWDPKNQRPELWNLYNTRKNRGESIRVFPLSNWTELDIWHYIHCEAIPVVPLYFARQRPVVVRDGMTLMVDDDRFRLLPGEEIRESRIRFRTLGCYPLSAGICSDASTVPEIILELIATRTSERQGRLIDVDASASMEKKKQEGYF